MAKKKGNMLRRRDGAATAAANTTAKMASIQAEPMECRAGVVMLTVEEGQMVALQAV